MVRKAAVALLTWVTVVVCLLALGAGDWRCPPLTTTPIPPRAVRAAAEIEHVDATAASSIAETPDPLYLSFPTRFGAAMKDGAVVNPNDGTRPGYCGTEDAVFYAWRGVSVDTLQIPGIMYTSGGDRVLDLARMKVTEIDPPVYYMPLPNGKFAPGYYGKTFVCLTFLRWKDITLKREQVPANALPKRLLTEKSAEYTIDIEPPKHILAQPELWKAK